MLTPLEQALPQLLAACATLAAARPADVESVPLPQALGRVLASAITATVDVPPYDNSAMDGYALRAGDWHDGVVLPVSQRIIAGAPPSRLLPGTVARIFTGAPMPDGADTVVMQEHAAVTAEGVVLSGPVLRSDNVRPRGQDIRRGAALFAPGHRLQPQDLGVLASVGCAQVPVRRRLRVAVLSTGNELREPGESLAPGQLYNSNRYTLAGLLTALGAEVVDGGIAADHLDATVAQLRRLAQSADVVITTGGVSAGEEDHVRAAIEQAGEVSLYKLAIKPGKPLTFGHLFAEAQQRVPVFGLPGNPAAVFVTFALIVRPCLLALQGVHDEPLPALPARADFDWPQAGRRAEYLRARIDVRDGELWVVMASNQSSGVLSAASWANALAVVPIGKTLVRGERVDVLLLDALLR